MKKRYLGSLFLGGVLMLSSCLNETVVKEQESLTPISFEKVTLNDRFWLPRLKTQKETLGLFQRERNQRFLLSLQTRKPEPIIQSNFFERNGSQRFLFFHHCFIQT